MRCASEKHGARDGGEGLEIEWAIEHVEALIEAHLALEENAADERSGAVSTRSQNRCESYSAWGNTFGILFDLVLKRVSGREERRMGWQRQRDLGIDGGEDGTVLGKRIDVRRVNGSIAVGAQVVGSKGIDRDDDYRLRLRETAPDKRR